MYVSHCGTKLLVKYRKRCTLKIIKICGKKASNQPLINVRADFPLEPRLKGGLKKDVFSITGLGGGLKPNPSFFVAKSKSFKDMLQMV